MTAPTNVPTPMPRRIASGGGEPDCAIGRASELVYIDATAGRGAVPLAEPCRPVRPMRRARDGAHGIEAQSARPSLIMHQPVLSCHHPALHLPRRPSAPK